MLYRKINLAQFILICSLLWSFDLQSAEWNGAPIIESVYLVAPDVLALRIKVGRVEVALQQPYERWAKDKIWSDTEYGSKLASRNGQPLGWIVGKGEKILFPFDEYEGEEISLSEAQDPLSYRLDSTNDSSYTNPKTPLIVHRKSRPLDYAQTGHWDFKLAMEHILYLELPQPLRNGCDYALEVRYSGLGTVKFGFDETEIRSEAIHVNQSGFRPDDPVKNATLSCWQGDGGGISYPTPLVFHLVDVESGKRLFSGKTVKKKDSFEGEDPYLNKDRNINQADVHLIDFSSVTNQGRFRILVEGIGVSFPFSISRQVWQQAFRTSMQGFYHQRSGIALGPPWTSFNRPLNFHPDSGMVFYQSRCSLMESGNGLNSTGQEKNNFDCLVKGQTTLQVKDVWGGYADAGDWDRRIQHLDATRLLLDLYQLFPSTFKGAKLGIPESANTIPDLLDECLWGTEVYRRLQMQDGSIRGGVESAEHPRTGECSWQESLPVFVYAPDLWSSYLYAATTMPLAILLKAYAPAIASNYYRSSMAAMAYAERVWKASSGKGFPFEVRDARNLAAAVFYRYTSNPEWHRIFLETTVFKEPLDSLAVWKQYDQREAAWVYLQTTAPRDEILLPKIRKVYLQEADLMVEISSNTAFGWTRYDKWSPIGWGVLSVPQAITLVRAHFMTKNRIYLNAALRSAQSGLGNNPANLSYTSGVGSVWPKNILVCDARRTGQPVPPGITVYGPFDVQKMSFWPMEEKAMGLEESIHPFWKSWPVSEAFFDVFFNYHMTEFTVMQTLGPTAYVWGYFAARR